jgi:hypothetical protein
MESDGSQASTHVIVHAFLVCRVEVNHSLQKICFDRRCGVQRSGGFGYLRDFVSGSTHGCRVREIWTVASPSCVRAV